MGVSNVAPAPKTWRNWSGNVTVAPREIVAPHDAGHIAEIVTAAAARGGRVKAVGAGHSFTAIAQVDDVQLDMSALAGLHHVDRVTGLVRVGAGTRLWLLNTLLATHGLALENLGDIDAQTISGALATGTHGTGARFGGLATQVRGLELVTADGTVRRFGATPGVPATEDTPVEAVVINLGALGVVTEVTLQAVPAFTMRAVEDQALLDDVLGALPETLAGCDHLDLYWFPYTDRCQTKTNTRLGPAPVSRPLARWRGWLDDELLSNGLFRVVNELASMVPRTAPTLNALSSRALTHREYEAPSHGVFITPRRVRFLESEMAVPHEALPDVLRELRAWMAGHREAAVQFPVEIRFAAGDEHWLSTAHGRDSAYIAVHQFHRSRFVDYFAALGAIVAGHGGRPHWGKMHDLDAATLARRYPRMTDFRALRDRLDPHRIFHNRYLGRVLGA